MKRKGKSVFKKPENSVEENWIRPSKVFCGLKMHVFIWNNGWWVPWKTKNQWFLFVISEVELLLILNNWISILRIIYHQVPWHKYNWHKIYYGSKSAKLLWYDKELNLWWNWACNFLTNSKSRISFLNKI